MAMTPFAGFSTNQKGNLGEAKVVAHFLALGYEVFTSFGTAVSFDLAIHRDGKIERVSVKTTSAKEKAGASWRVKLSREARLKSRAFDKDGADIIAVYIEPEDRVVLLSAASIKTKFTTTIKFRGRR